MTLNKKINILYYKPVRKILKMSIISKTFHFFSEIKRDLKVTKWASKDELFRAALTTFSFAIFFGFLIFGFDAFLSKMYNLIVF